MSEKTKLSAGALRAATACFNLPYGSAPTKSTADWTVGQMARIIDRETGMAELLDAAKQLLDLKETRPQTEKFLELEQAIAKAEAK